MPSGQKVAAAVILAAITCLLFSPMIRQSQINLDDYGYINNLVIKRGLHFNTAWWALTSTWFANWHPLTWMSLMLDHSIFGGADYGFKLTNLLLHVTNTVLTLHLIHRITGKLGVSIIVAALFAAHPLHIEPVAWISSRKDVLSTLFWTLTLITYLKYHQTETKTRKHYWVALVLYTLAAMAKPMVVTLPALLLLLDFWPLNRIPLTNLKDTVKTGIALAREKLPFFAVSAALAVLTWVAQDSAAAIAPIDKLPLWMRLNNAVWAYAEYLKQMVAPFDLTMMYPYVHNIPWYELLAASTLLTLITIVVLTNLKKRPYLLLAWGWYLVTLLPTIGLVQVGRASHADRYTYISLTGVFLAGVLLTTELINQLNWTKKGAAFAKIALPSALLFGCAALTTHQLTFWTNAFILCLRNQEVSGDYTMQANLATLYSENNQYEAAHQEIIKALGKAPRDINVYQTYGIIEMQGKQYENAYPPLKEAVLKEPDNLQIAKDYATVLYCLKRYEEAEAVCRKYIAKTEKPLPFYHLLAHTLLAQGRKEEAKTAFVTALDNHVYWDKYLTTHLVPQPPNQIVGDPIKIIGDRTSADFFRPIFLVWNSSQTSQLTNN